MSIAIFQFILARKNVKARTTVSRISNKCNIKGHDALKKERRTLNDFTDLHCRLMQERVKTLSASLQAAHHPRVAGDRPCLYFALLFGRLVFLLLVHFCQSIALFSTFKWRLASNISKNPMNDDTEFLGKPELGRQIPKPYTILSAHKAGTCLKKYASDFRSYCFRAVGYPAGLFLKCPSLNSTQLGPVHEGFRCQINA